MNPIKKDDATAAKTSALTFKAVQLIGRSTVVSYFKCNCLPSIGILLVPENSHNSLRSAQTITSVEKGSSGYYVNTNKGNRFYLTED